MSERVSHELRVASLRECHARVTDRVSLALARVHRPADGVTIVAVTKRHPPEVLEAAYAAGIRDMGENYAQEFSHKFEAVSFAAHVRWHFIGHLQSNKAKYLVGRTALIHAVDSLSAVRALDNHMARWLAHSGREHDPSHQDVLVAVNLGDEAQKSGVTRERIRDFLEQLSEFNHVRCQGFMTMPPMSPDPEESRRFFAELAELRERESSALRPLPHLSMGTTHDFDVAVEEGATIIRVGTAIFGPRPAPR